MNNCWGTLCSLTEYQFTQCNICSLYVIGSIGAFIQHKNWSQNVGIESCLWFVVQSSLLLHMKTVLLNFKFSILFLPRIHCGGLVYGPIAGFSH